MVNGREARRTVAPGQRNLLVDDQHPTGGMLVGCRSSIKRLGGQIIGAAFLNELDFLNGRAELGENPVHMLIRYGEED